MSPDETTSILPIVPPEPDNDSTATFATGMFKNGTYNNRIDFTINGVDKVHGFKNKCLLFALFTGYNLNKYANGEMSKKKGKLLSRLFKTKIKKSAEISEAINLLKVYLTAWFPQWEEEEHSSRKLTFDDAYYFCNRQNVQAHVFILTSTCKVQLYCSFPNPEYNPKAYQVYLFYDEISSHIELIELIDTFMSKHGKYCFMCQEYRNKGSYQHKCERDDLQCHICRREFRYQNYKKVYGRGNKFCDSKINPSQEKLTCDICKFDIYSVDCQKNHSPSAICKRWYKCQKENCGETIFLDGVEKNRQPQIDAHDCLSVKCSDCKLKVDPFTIHDCKLLKSRPQKSHPNLFFLSFAYFTNYYTKLGENVCDRGPNYACLYYKNMEDTYDSIHFKDWQTESNVVQTNHNAISLKTCRPKKISSQFGKLSDKITFKQLFVPFPDHLKVVSQVIDFIFNENARESYNSTCLVSSREDLLFLSKVLSLLEFTNIDVTSVGTGIQCIHIEEREITFLDIHSYTNLELIDHKIKLATKESVLFFPWNLSNGKNSYWLFNSAITEDDILNRHDKPKITSAKRQYFKTLSKETQSKYCFQENLEKYMDFHTCSVMLVAKTFLEQFSAIEDHFQKKSQLEFSDIEYTKVFPFTKQTSTYTAAIFYLSKLYFLNVFDLRVLRFEYTGVPVNNCSKPESEYVQFLHFENKDVTHSFTNIPIPRFKGKGSPDAHLMGKSGKKNKGFWMDGCWTHFHNIDECPILQKTHKFSTLTKSQKQQIRELNFKMRRSKQKDFLKVISENPVLLEDQEVITQCTWNQMKKENPKVMNFMKNEYKSHVIKEGRLIPREALRGGYVDSYSFSYETKENPYCSFKSYDVRSLYPFLAKTKKFPVGPCERFCDINPQQIEITDKNVMYKSIPMFGIAQVRVFAPRKLRKPFLYCNPKGSNCSYLTLCHECVKTTSTRLTFEKPPEFCSHTDSQRSWVSVYTTVELVKAHLLGYHFTFYELHHWENSYKIFTEFIDVLSSQKLKSSGIPNNVDPQKYCDEINANMKFFSKDLELTPDNVKFDPDSKEFNKLMLNSVLGKNAQKRSAVSSKITSSLKDIHKACENESIVDIEAVSFSKFLIVTKNANIHRANFNNNSIIYAFLTAYGRIFIYGAMEVLEQNKAEIFYVNTDGIFYKIPKKIDLTQNLDIFGYSLGKFVEEYEGIQSFFSLGPRNYSMLLRDSNGQYKEITKISGLSITTAVTSIVNHSSYQKLVNNLIAQTYDELKAPQAKCAFRTLRNDVYRYRIVDFDSSCIQTYPHGYKK